jgi:hypothetical protein
MTILRKPLTVEHILASILKDLDENQVKEITGKSLSHFRKCSDPSDKDHNLYLADAIKLDLILQKAQKGTPFLNNFEVLLNHELSNIDNPNNISNTLINIGGRIGKLMDVTNQSIDPKSSEGENISNIEKERIHRAIREVEEKMARLKLSIK